MAAIDLPTAQAKLDFWLGVEEKLALGQKVQHDGRGLERANLGDVRLQIEFWEQRVNRAARDGRGVTLQRVVPARG